MAYFIVFLLVGAVLYLFLPERSVALDVFWDTVAWAASLIIVSGLLMLPFYLARHW